MAKASSKKKVVRATGAKSTTPAGLRREAARLDREIARQLNAKAKVMLKLASLDESKDDVMAMPDPAEWAATASKVNRGPLSDAAIEAILRELQSGWRTLVTPTRVAFLGPLYSYSHLATVHRFGHATELAAVGSIAAVFEEVNRGHADFGLVPIENSTDGRVADTLDMFTRLPVKICDQVELRIHHTLLGRGSRSEVREVYSKPQALSQCRNWLAKHLPAARPIEVTSTSTAAQLAKEKPGAAAIASREAGEHYGLSVLAEQIEDNPANATRFAVIGDSWGRKTGDDRTAVLFQTEHRFGTLVDALAVFKRNRLNMTWIESFPVPGSERAYVFFVELEGYPTEAKMKRSLELVEKRSLRFEVLGAYPAREPEEV